MRRIPVAVLVEIVVAPAAVVGITEWLLRPMRTAERPAPQLRSIEVYEVQNTPVSTQKPAAAHPPVA